jgi:carbon monoxide dehydrogenase subunit G
MPSVSRSIDVDASPGTVWSIVRDFNGLPAWFPGIAASEIEGGGDANTVGAIRRLTLPDGAQIRETLLELSDGDRLCTYNIIESGLPISNYVATFRVTAQGDGSRIDWEAAWENDPEVEQAMIDLIGDTILAGGLQGAKEKAEG